LFDAFRAHALSHPLLLFLLCLLAARLGGTALLKKVAGTFAGRLPASLLVSGLYLGTVAAYVAIPAYFDHVEPSVAAVSWAVMRGQEAYPAADAPVMYGLPYGPMLYLLNGLTLTMVGPSLPASKVAGGFAAIASLILAALAARRAGRRDWPRVLRWTALVYLAFGATTFWVRAEPLLLLCSSLALVSLTLPPVLAALTAGVALGLGINLKISAVIYLLPPLVVAWRKFDHAILALTLATATIVAAIPFAMIGNISLTGYLYWVQSTSAHGFRLRALPTALEWAALVALPLLVARARESFEADTEMRRWLIVAIFASVPLALKHGTGYYHYLPFVPLVVFAARGAPMRAPLLLTWVILAGCQFPHWFSTSTALPAREILAELRAIEQENEGTIGMGYSPNYRLSFFRPQLVFDGQPYAIDGASVMDAAWSGRSFPPAVIESVRSCAFQVWLIPASSSPFELPNAYASAEQVFPEELRQVFRDRYEIAGSRKWFDVWRCVK
jgi:hypothetical protein